MGNYCDIAVAWYDVPMTLSDELSQTIMRRSSISNRTARSTHDWASVATISLSG